MLICRQILWFTYVALHSLVSTNAEYQLRIKYQTKTMHPTLVMSIKVNSYPLLERNVNGDKLWGEGSVVEGWQ